MEPENEKQVEVLLGNSNRRFSGVTATLLHTMPIQKKLVNLKVLGLNHLPDPSDGITFCQAVALCRQPRNSNLKRVFHARRNNEMVQALVLKTFFDPELKIVFTSTAQRYHTRFTRYLMSRMDAVVSTCQAAARYLDPPPTAIIPHGVDLQKYHPSGSKLRDWKNLGFGGKLGIGVFGRVRPLKGIDLFVEACIRLFPEHEDCSALIVGEITPDNRAFARELKENIRNAGLTERIWLLGEQHPDKVAELMRSVSLVAALSRNEGFGLTPLEAMASGTAVITSSAGAWPDIVDNRVGRRTETGNLEQIVIAMDELLGDTESLEILGKNGRERVEKRYSVEAEARALVNLYERLAREPGKP